MTTTRSILTTELNDASRQLIQNYKSKGLRASGRGENLSIEVASTGFGFEGKITGPIQWWFMENGRKPNKNKSRGAIYFLSQILDKWADDKGIKINTWLAAKKIVFEGIQVPNRHNPGGVISDTINKDWFEGIAKKLNMAHVEQYKTIARQW